MARYVIDVVPDTEYLRALFKGKDYSNPRIADFFNLDKPEDDMYDRSRVPRMPWYVFLFPFALGLLQFVIQA
jgi:hypothetical protein